MAVSYIESGLLSRTTGTSLSPRWPTNKAVGDLLVLVVSCKFDTASVTTPTGWTLAFNQTGGAGSNGADSGTMRCYVFVREVDGTESGSTESLTASNNNVSQAQMFLYRKASGTIWGYAATGGSDNSAGASWTATGASNPGITSGDMVIAASAVNADPYTFASHAFSASGVTFATADEREEAATSSGSDQLLLVADATVSSGTATAAPVYTATASGSSSNAPAGATVILRIREALPTISQAAFRFYEDGTESGSTAIDTQDTSITRAVDSDSNLALRLRLQESAGNPGNTTDDYQLQYEVNDSDTWSNVGSGPVIGDNNVSATMNEIYVINGGTGTTSEGQQASGQSFVASVSYTLDSIDLWLLKGGSPTDTLNIELYTGSETGTLIASSSIAGTSITSGSPAQMYNFPITGGPSIVAGTTYYIACTRTGARDTTNRYGFGITTQNQFTGGIMRVRDNNVWGDYTGFSGNADITFRMNGSSPALVGNYSSANLTDGGATTNRLGAGSGSFVAGEVSEDGLVDDHQLTANNYTEHLYSLTLVAAELANNDTLDFRVLRNGAALNTYTVTPRITASKGGGGGPTSSGSFWPFF